MNEIEKLAQEADFIVNGYSFFVQNGSVRVLNLNDLFIKALPEE